MSRPHSLLALLALLACLLAPLALAQVTITTEADLHDKMFDPSVTNIIIATPYLAFTDDSLWPTTRALLSRSLVIEGKAGMRPTLDFQYRLSRLQLAPGVLLHLKNLEIFQSENSVPISFIANSPGATVRLERCVARNKVCAPAEVSAVFNILALRGQACVVANYCRARGACFKRAVHVDYFNWRTPAFTMDGSTNAGGYNCEFVNTYEVCESPFSWQCIVNNIASPLGVNYCRATAFAAQGIPAPTAEQYAAFAGGPSMAGPMTKETLTYLYNTIQANWCANMESISPQQMINEAGNYWNQYSGRKLRLAA